MSVIYNEKIFYHVLLNLITLSHFLLLMPSLITHPFSNSECLLKTPDLKFLPVFILIHKLYVSHSSNLALSVLRNILWLY